jgi:hypothetical protein
MPISVDEETPLERSFRNIRGDIMDRSPAAEDLMIKCDREVRPPRPFLISLCSQTDTR